MKYRWHIQPGEKGHEYFAIYRDMGPRRSLLAAYHIFQRQQGATKLARLAPGNWIDLSEKFHWQARAQAFDVHMDEIRIAEAESVARKHAAKWEERRQKTIEDEYNLGVALAAAAATKATAAAQNAGVDLGGLASTAEQATILRRRACGLSFDPAADDAQRKLARLEAMLEAGYEMTDELEPAKA